MQKVQIHSDFPQALLDAFKWKARSMSPLSKKCALIFDEITIKENVSYNSEKDFEDFEGFEDFAFGRRSKYVANHATVFMVRGLETNGSNLYFLSSGTIKPAMLKTLIFECLEKLLSALKN